jgi:outer membrane immunogenic protein
MHVSGISAVALVALATFGVGAAAAADPYIDPPTIVETDDVFDWTGFYIGAQVGGAFGTARIENIFDLLVPPAGDSFRADPAISGIVGGVHAGYHQQFGSFVLGGETDVNWNGASGTAPFTYYPPAGAPGVDPVETGTFDMIWDGSVRGKIGVALNRWMPFVTGGIAFGQADISEFRDWPLGAAPPGPAQNFTGTVNLIGATVGVGTSFAVTERVFLTGQVVHSWYGATDVALIGQGAGPPFFTETARISAGVTKATVGVSVGF